VTAAMKWAIHPTVEACIHRIVTASKPTKVTSRQRQAGRREIGLPAQEIPNPKPRREPVTMKFIFIEGTSESALST
jgi:hypothetical protein